MAVLSRFIDFFSRSLVPSVESVLGQGFDVSRAVSTFVERHASGLSINRAVLMRAIQSVQRAIDLGKRINRGWSVDRADIPIDPTLKGVTEYRYRVLVNVEYPHPIYPRDVQTLSTIVSIDSNRMLSKRELVSIAKDITKRSITESVSPKMRAVMAAVASGPAITEEYRVVSVYRAP